MAATVGSRSSSLRRRDQMQCGPYTLRQLLADIPLSSDDSSSDIHVTCVELWAENLYIGTSTAEVLHFVLIPPEPDDPLGQPQCILASRQQPAFTHASTVGIQQILILPRTGKACILCNNALTFYSLPELTPAFANTPFANTRPITCNWIGGVDLNDEDEEQTGTVIVICLKTKIRVVRIAEEPRVVRTIEYGGCSNIVRRDNFACVADGQEYALLDVVNQQKIPLFPISSETEQGAASAPDAAEAASGSILQTKSRSASNASLQPQARPDRGHSRSTSLGIFQGGPGRQESPRPKSSSRHGFDAPESLSRMQSPSPAMSPERRGQRNASPAVRAVSPNKPLPPDPGTATSGRSSLEQSRKQTPPLRSHIVSPTSTEFLLTTGSSPSDPGVGMFVNLDGEVVRGTLEFSSYPDSLVADGKGVDPSASLRPGEAQEEGYVLALLRRPADSNEQAGIEIQRWDIEQGSSTTDKNWMDLSLWTTAGTSESEEPLHTSSVGLRKTMTSVEMGAPEIAQRLATKRLRCMAGGSQRSEQQFDAEQKQEREELAFYDRMCKFETSVILWTGNQLWWMLRNPSVLRLDAQLRLAQSSIGSEDLRVQPVRGPIEYVMNSIRGQEPQSELELFGLRYVRQKAAVLLFMDLVIKTLEQVITFEQDKRFTEEALITSEIDPRIPLSMVPTLRDEIVEGSKGIWIQGGIREIVEVFMRERDITQMRVTPSGPFGDNLLQLLKRYLLAWRKKKGFGSVEDATQVFLSVDAALLQVLLLLDSQSPRGPAKAGSTRAELNSVVDAGLDCFDRAVELLEQYKRLYVLSRLYQSKRMSAKVLETWRRIIEREEDAGGEFADGENEMRKFLATKKDASLVEEYGSWLAHRNPRLGVQVFSDDSSKIKFEPANAVAILKQRAPGAVKDYLEHLVFGKKLPQYINDLIAFYLDIVVGELERSEESRNILLSTYETYRALRAPKPTYRQFITDNALDAEWWHSRLRLLQLLGTNQGAASSYDIDKVSSRLAPYEQELVPEMIILNGRQGQHERAIRLLTHGLGDFDTAISYCLLGGSSIFRPPSGVIPQEALPGHDEQAGLFQHLFHEFLRIEDISERIERTSELLERFSGWFDIGEVLSMIPDSWSLHIISGFLVNALRRIIQEKSESTIMRALSSAQNLKMSTDLVEKMEAIGPTIERAA